MTPNTPHTDPHYQDAILELIEADKLPDAELVEDVVSHYPEFATEITDFAVELAIDMLVNAGEEQEVPVDLEEVSPMVARAISNFENELFLRNQESAENDKTAKAAPEVTTVDPFASMNRQSFRAFATAIHANKLFAIKIRDQQIRLTTIPVRYLEMVAESMRISLDQLREYLSRRNGRFATGNQFFKADDKPNHELQQSFDEAVADSGMTDEQQQFLLGLK